MPRAIDIALTLVSSPGEIAVDSSNLSASVDADRAVINGKLWLNSAPADRPVVLRRVNR